MNASDHKRVVMLSAEASPFVKVGGLADVIGALPKALESLGVQPTIVLPAYRAIAREKFGIRPSEAVAPFDVPAGSGTLRVEIEQAKLPGSGIDVFFVGGGNFFARDGVYDDPATKTGYGDNMKRFAFFARAALELLRRLGRPVDVLHCHDSQTGLIPGLLHTVYEQDPYFSRSACLFTIHNLAYQGLYPAEVLPWIGIDPVYFYPLSPFEYWGKVNFMKIGIEMADLVNTVSETYAHEIQTSSEYGYGLEGVLRNRSDELHGIVNGISYEEWNPETDPYLTAHFSAADLSGKARCKDALLQAMGLPKLKGRVPLAGIISRLVDQKGFDLIEAAIDRIAAQDLQLVILGTGQTRYHDFLESLPARHTARIAVRFGFDNGLAHRIEAGADMFLMPSKYEPCGLNQLYSLRYGTVPIVRATGGLADTIEDYDIQKDTGTGFVFEAYTAKDMLAAIERALVAYADSSRWTRLAARGMAQHWSWEDSARKYAKLYDQICQDGQD
jgi:starch synthase